MNSWKISVAASLLAVSTASYGKVDSTFNPMNGETVRRAYVLPMLTIEKQKGMLWCWAASISTIFKHYGHPVAQEVIVERIKGIRVDQAGWPGELAKALNSEWVDSNGIQFKATCQIHDMDSGISTFGNPDIMADLTYNKPILYCNANHAMVLVEATCVISPYGVVRIVEGKVLDPYPLSPSPRFLNPMSEGFPRFAARVRVKKLK